jgi:hypothetical protein
VAHDRLDRLCRSDLPVGHEGLRVAAEETQNPVKAREWGGNA